MALEIPKKVPLPAQGDTSRYEEGFTRPEAVRSLSGIVGRPLSPEQLRQALLEAGWRFKPHCGEGCTGYDCTFCEEKRQDGQPA